MAIQNNLATMVTWCTKSTWDKRQNNCFNFITYRLDTQG